MAWVKGLVIGMGLLLLAGFAVIVVTLINRIGSSDTQLDSANQAELTMKTGERLIETSLDGANILFHFVGPDGTRVVVRKLSNGAKVSEFNIHGASK